MNNIQEQDKKTTECICNMDIKIKMLETQNNELKEEIRVGDNCYMDKYREIEGLLKEKEELKEELDNLKYDHERIANRTLVMLREMGCDHRIEVEKLKEQCEEFKSDFHTMEEGYDGYRVEYEKLEKENEELKEELDNLKYDHQELKDENDGLGNIIEILEDENEKNKDFALHYWSNGQLGGKLRESAPTEWGWDELLEELEECEEQ